MLRLPQAALTTPFSPNLSNEAGFLSVLPKLPVACELSEYFYYIEKQYDIVKSLLLREDIDTIYVCTDSGREGEYIYRLVEQMVGVKRENKEKSLD